MGTPAAGETPGGMGTPSTPPTGEAPSMPGGGTTPPPLRRLHQLHRSLDRPVVRRSAGRCGSSKRPQCLHGWSRTAGAPGCGELPPYRRARDQPRVGCRPAVENVVGHGLWVVGGERKLNGCDESGKPWENEKWCTIYPSKTGTPLVTFIHPGDHAFSREAPAAIVKFFKQHPPQ